MSYKGMVLGETVLENFSILQRIAPEVVEDYHEKR
jgi:hypothetical protein